MSSKEELAICLTDLVEQRHIANLKEGRLQDRVAIVQEVFNTYELILASLVRSYPEVQT